jgi:hypothetical protein
MNTEYRSRWDIIGIGASIACAIHCILLPIIFTTVTLFGIEFIENPYMEALTIILSMSAGSWALLRDHKHKGRGITWTFIAGLSLMITGNFLHGAATEIGFKLSGSALIVYAHFKNLRHSKKGPH